MEIKYLQVLVMNNGEIFCCGESLGFLNKEQQQYLFHKAEVATPKE